jgi:hypothetical protein
MGKRILLGSVTVVALMLGGLLANTAQAHGPPGCAPRHSSYRAYGGYGGYGSYYRGPAQCYHRVVPYGAGYIGGWQPYQQSPPVISRRPSFGFYFGY